MGGFAYLSRAFSERDENRRNFLIEKQAKQRNYVEALRQGTCPEAQGKDWAGFAQGQLDTALKTAWHTNKQAHSYAQKIDVPEGPIPGLFILGLGKLGGRDLNFSSDVDLIAFYDVARLPVPEGVGREHICAQVLRTFIKLIDGHTQGAFAWRTDWRLRPDPSVTDLAMSTHAGLDYFFFQSAPWRRLAMLKARVVAGDHTAGDRFLNDLHSFIWRRHLDFSMVEEIAHLKQRIHLEHPDLADSRRQSHELINQTGFHLKLGRGGIRDIEFVANALQLLWGGRESQLQTSHTQTALRILGQMGKLTSYQQLLAAYADFRRMENAVQSYQDRHIHTLSNDPGMIDWVTEVCGLSLDHLTAQIAHHRALVSQCFERLFAEISPAPKRHKLLHISAFSIGLSERRGLELNPILARMDQQIANLNHPEQGVKILQSWLPRIRGLPAYLKALQDTPALADLAFESALNSPVISNLIAQSPRAIDCLFAHGDLLHAPDVSALIKNGAALINASPKGDSQLAALRTWVNESLYVLYLSLYSGAAAPDQGPIFLTDLAEGALDLCAQVAAQNLDLPRLPFTILAMGRLGLKRMAPGSDLDLIFVLDEGIGLEAGNQAVGRFISTMNARLNEGRVYEIDTRLRPSGASGPPTVSFDTFANHQLSRAKTWEHLALTFMRPLHGTWHGNDRQIKNLIKLKHQVLSQTRATGQWRADCQLMLRRLLDQRIGQGSLEAGEVKLAMGGLMEQEYIQAAHILTAQGVQTHGEAAGALDLTTELTTQIRALQHHRLMGADWKQSAPDLARAFEESCLKVRAKTEQMLGLPETYPSAREHTEMPVHWE